jgi:hypothetical protein
MVMTVKYGAANSWYAITHFTGGTITWTIFPCREDDKAIREPWRIALGCLKITGHKDTGRWINTYLKDIPVEKISACRENDQKGDKYPLQLRCRKIV